MGLCNMHQALADFGARSLLTHALMAVGFAGAVVSGLGVSGQVGVISMVAFINFTAGLWVCQSIHSLGQEYNGSSYDGVIAEVIHRAD